MSNINNTPFVTPEEKIEAHFKKYRDEYILLGLGVGIGLTLAGIFRKPRVTEAAAVNKWISDMAEHGISIYGLTNEQKALWESTWAYAMKGAEIFHMSQPEAIERLTKTQLKSVAENFKNLRAVV